MKKHLILTCCAAFYFGYGTQTMQLGIKGGFGYWPTMIVWCTSFIFWVVIAFTSLQKIQTYLKKNNEQTDKVSDTTEEPQRIEP